MQIRPTTTNDIEAVLTMYDHSRRIMRANGNTIQWVGYPTRHDVADDVAWNLPTG